MSPARPAPRSEFRREPATSPCSAPRAAPTRRRSTSSATITNLRASCSEDATYVVSTASFDVVATRRDAGEARQVTLPYYNVVAQGGSDIVAKKIGYVALNFPAGSVRAQTNAQATGRVSRSAVALPEDIYRELTRTRKPGDPDAAVDPLSDPGSATRWRRRPSSS